MVIWLIRQISPLAKCPPNALCCFSLRSSSSLFFFFFSLTPLKKEEGVMVVGAYLGIFLVKESDRPRLASE